MAINFCLYELIKQGLPQGDCEGEEDQQETEAGSDIDVSLCSRRRRACYKGTNSCLDLTLLWPR